MGGAETMKNVSLAAGNKVLDSVLNDYEIKHTYEENEGDHINRIGPTVLQFFSGNLSFEQPKRR